MVTVSRSVRKVEIARDERVYQNAGSNRNEYPNRQYGALAAQDQVWFGFELTDYGRHRGIKRHAQREQNSKSAYIFHISGSGATREMLCSP